jgi:RNA polymerase-binding transcription factor DksA
VTDDARHALEGARAAALERIAQLTRDIDRVVEATAAANTDDEHDPEGATIAFERAQAVSLREQAAARLAEADAALARLAAGSYGRCEACGEAIAADRLAARPAARTCISCAANPRRAPTRH